MESKSQTAVCNSSRIKRRLANLTIKQNIPYQVIQKISQKHKTTIRQNEWTFNFKEYNAKSIRELFQAAQKILIKELRLHYCKQASILKQIYSIQFPQLKLLYLCGNSIKNLEAFSSLNAIHIEKLYLRKKYLTSLRPLKRCYFPELKNLDLSENRLRSLDQLWEIFYLSKIQQLQFYGNQGLSFTFGFTKAKLTYHKIDSLWIGSEKNYQILAKKMARVFQYLGVKKVRVIYG